MFSNRRGSGSLALAVLAAIECSASSTITNPKLFDLLLPLAFTCRAFLSSTGSFRFWNSIIRKHFAE